MYGTRTAVHVWCKKFAHGRESVAEEGPGRRVVLTIDVPVTIAPVDCRIQSDWCVMG